MEIPAFLEVLNLENSEIQTLESLVDPFQKLQVTTGNEMSDELEILKTQQDSLHDDILDYMDENRTTHLLLVEDIDASIRRMEEFRSKYRGNHKDLCRLSDPTYNVEYTTQLTGQ